MTPLKAIKTFRDLLSFLTIIPVRAKEDFIFTSAKNLYLFPLIGAFLGLLGAGYYVLCSFIVAGLASFAVSYIAWLPVALLVRFVPAAMTVAFLLVLTGLQHFDGLVDLGNTVGVRNVQERKKIAHVWTVTYSGALLALLVEISAFIGLFLINPIFAVAAIVAAEICAKLAMVTIVWIGKPAHKGLGSAFLKMAKKRLNITAYIISILIILPLFTFFGTPFLGLIGVTAVLISVFVGFFMEKVSIKAFNGVSGDTIGATNEVSRAVTLLLLAGVLMLI
jgi:adenosylcobinamide-GDP ribazoletransferase